jgi:DNA-binding MarR family transcriptional regulator
MSIASDELGNVGPLAGLISVRLRRLDLLLIETVYGPDLRAEAIVCLAVISARPGISQSEVARLTRRDPATIVGLVNDLTARGLASREASQGDRRKHALHLTPLGETELQRLASELRAAEESLLAGMDPAEIAFLVHLLDKMHAACRAALERRKALTDAAGRQPSDPGSFVPGTDVATRKPPRVVPSG